MAGDISGPASGRGINGLVLNLIVPGLGAIYCGKGKLGAQMLALAGGGVVVCFLSLVVGLLMIVGAYVWSALVGFQLMSETTT